MNAGFWKHLFINDAEYASPKRILSGLTLEQVTHKPAGASHSIYEELWHTATWQNIVVFRDEEGYAQWPKQAHFPTEAPASLGDWLGLVERFFAGIERILELGSSAETLREEVEPGISMETMLYTLAVHNAYHMGKIVSLRQTMGLWPPAEQTAG